MSRLHGSKEFWIGALRTEGPAFQAAISETPADTPVLSCPGWTVTDLAHHLGSVYGWVRGILRGGTEAPARRVHSEGLGTGAAAAQWWRQEYDQLMADLDRIDPETPTWNWAPQPKRAGFWIRRMAHETVIHRWDAQMAAAAGEPIEPKLAVDGISEVLDTWLPAGRRPSPRGQWHGMVQLVAVDAAQEWFLRLRGEGVALLDTDTILDSDQHPARAHAAGTASDLLLALWGRIGFDVLDISGDAALLEGLRGGS